MILIKILENIRLNNNSKLFIISPLISILWANMHGGTIAFVVVFPLIYLLFGMFKFNNDRIYSINNTKKQIEKYLYVLISNLIFSLINPFTYKIYL